MRREWRILGIMAFFVMGAAAAGFLSTRSDKRSELHPAVITTPTAETAVAEDESGLTADFVTQTGSVQAIAPRMSANQAAARIRESLTAAGWNAERLEIPLESVEFDDEDHRAARAWRFLPEGGPHVLIDADSGALLYLETFRFADQAEWEFNFPHRPVSLERARAIVETLTASQYSAFSPRTFELSRTRPLEKWPLWDLDYVEVADSRSYANKVSVMVDWTTGQVLEFVASNIDATYNGSLNLDSAYEAALRLWDRSQGPLGGDVILRSHSDLKIAVDEQKAAYPSWLFRFDFSCGHDSGWHGTSVNVLVNGASGEILGWGGVSH